MFNNIFLNSYAIPALFSTLNYYSISCVAHILPGMLCQPAESVENEISIRPKTGTDSRSVPNPEQVQANRFYIKTGIMIVSAPSLCMVSSVGRIMDHHQILI